MPGMDGTGPYGKGPMTGGGFGRYAEARGSGGYGCGHRPHRRRCAGIYSREYISDTDGRDAIEELKQRNKELEEKISDIAAAVEELRSGDSQTH